MSVPKIIHQLWIGEKPIPINALNSVKNMNPDYEYMFWCEDKLKELSIPKKYSQKIRLMEELNGKADMYRWIILKKYGGVFVDADMVSIQPIDDFLLNESFFCWENEMARPNLCATSIMGLTPNHIICEQAIDWIINNRITSPAWKSVGPLLLSNIYHSLEDKSVVKVYPSYYFLPDHHSGIHYKGHGKVYMTHEWGSTRNNYNEINIMNIPSHHTPPKKSIDITIPSDTKLIKEVMKGIKHLDGHFNINISCEKDISKYLKSMRNVGHLQCNEDNELIYYDENDEIIDHFNVEEVEQGLCKRHIKKDDVVLELGARYGTLSCLVNRMIDDKKNHYVVEPDSKVWSALEDNRKINNCDFNIIKGVIGKEKYKLEGRGYAMRTTTDSSYGISQIDNYDIPDVEFNTLIADCEGYMEVFYNENKNFFKNISKIIMECDCPDICDYDKLLKEFSSLGFTIREHIFKYGLHFYALEKVKYDKYEILDNNREVKDEIENIEYNI